MSSDDDKDTREPVLVCRNKGNKKIQHIDVGLCERRFGFFGKWIPLFECGDKHNKHTCELMSRYDIKHLDEYEKNTI
jgi:hypothetical protein